MTVKQPEWRCVSAFQVPRNRNNAPQEPSLLRKFIASLLKTKYDGFLVPTGNITTSLLGLPAKTPAWLTVGMYGLLPDSRPFVVYSQGHATGPVIEMAKGLALALPSAFSTYFPPLTPVRPRRLAASEGMLLLGVEVHGDLTPDKQVYTFYGFSLEGTLCRASVKGDLHSLVWSTSQLEGCTPCLPMDMIAPGEATAYMKCVSSVAGQYDPNKINWSFTPVMQYLHRRGLVYGKEVRLSEDEHELQSVAQDRSSAFIARIPLIPVAMRFATSDMAPPHTVAFVYGLCPSQRVLHVCTSRANLRNTQDWPCPYPVEIVHALDGNVLGKVAEILQKTYNLSGGVFIGDMAGYWLPLSIVFGDSFFYLSADLVEYWRCLDVFVGVDHGEEVVDRCLQVLNSQEATFDHAVTMASQTGYIPFSEISRASPTHIAQSAIQAKRRASGDMGFMVFPLSTSTLRLTNSTPACVRGMFGRSRLFDFRGYFPSILMTHKELTINPFLIHYLQYLTQQRAQTGKLAYKLLANQVTGLLAHFSPEDYNRMTARGRENLSLAVKLVKEECEGVGQVTGEPPKVIMSNTDGFLLCVANATEDEAMQQVASKVSSSFPDPMILREEVGLEVVYIHSVNQYVGRSSAGDLYSRGTVLEQKNACELQRTLFKAVAFAVLEGPGTETSVECVHKVQEHLRGILIALLDTERVGRSTLALGARFDTEAKTPVGQLARDLVAKGVHPPQQEIPLRFIYVIDTYFRVHAEVPSQGHNRIFLPAYIKLLQEVLDFFVPYKFTPVVKMLETVSNVRVLYAKTPGLIRFLYPKKAKSYICIFCGLSTDNEKEVCRCMNGQRGKRNLD